MNLSQMFDGDQVHVEYKYDKTPTFTLIPGRYRVKVVKDKITEEKEIEVVPGKNERQEIVLAAQGRLTLSAVYEAGGESVKPKYWEVYSTVPDVEGDFKKIEHELSSKPNFYTLTWQIQSKSC